MSDIVDPFWPEPELCEIHQPEPKSRDVVSKLRELDSGAKRQGELHEFTPTPMFGLAADEIEASRLEISRLREALEPFAKAADAFDGPFIDAFGSAFVLEDTDEAALVGGYTRPECVDADDEVEINVGDLRRAREVLNRGKDT